MTRAQIDHVVRGLGPVIRELVTAAVQEQAAALGGLAGRVTALETAAPATVAEAVTVRERLARFETAAATAEATAGLVGTLRERVAVVEARAPIAGPVGPPGPGFEDVAAVLKAIEFSYDGKRTITATLRAGEVCKSFEWIFPVLIDAGTYKHGVSYTCGDVVTWDGCTWVCVEATSAKPLEGAKAWRLQVKRGRDGKDADRDRRYGAAS